jgi:hypothetical protein
MLSVGRYARDTDPPSQHAIGHGPQRGILREGIKLLTSDRSFWGIREDYLVPLLWPLITMPVAARNRDFWVCGSWAALHMVILGLGPEPIAPWWILAAIYGIKSMDLELDYIEALDPKSAQLLKPWYKFSAADTLQEVAINDPVYRLLIQYLEMTDVRLPLVSVYVC